MVNSDECSAVRTILRIHRWAEEDDVRRFVQGHSDKYAPGGVVELFRKRVAEPRWRKRKRPTPAPEPKPQPKKGV